MILPTEKRHLFLWVKKMVKFRVCHRHCLMLGTGLICSHRGSNILFLRNKWLVPQRNGSCLVKLVSPSPFLKNLDFLPFWLFFRHNKWKHIHSRQNKLFLLSGLSLVIVWAFHLSFPSFQSVIRDSPNVAMSGFHPIALSIYYIYIHNQQLIHLIFNSGYTIYNIFIYIYILYIVNHHQSSP